MTNTNELTAKLKAAAEKARWGNWSAYKPHKGARGYEVRVGCEAVAQHCLKDDADFIAEASPKVVLELIAQNEALVAAHMNLKLLADVYRQAYEEARARTVTVELPRGYVGPYGSLVYDADAVDAALELAGINLETGGE